MREFKSLHPSGLVADYDVAVMGEQPIVDVEESPGRIRLTYRFPGFYISDDEHSVKGRDLPFKGVTIASIGSLGESGKPMLPSFGRYVQIPPNSSYKLSVYPSEPVQFDDVLVSPAQMELTDGAEEDHEFEYDETLYASEEVYPKEIVQVSGPFEMDAYTALRVHVCPFQYIPARRKLIGYANVEVILDISAQEGEPEDYPASDPERNNEAFGNLFLNPSRNIAERLRVQPIVGRVPFWPLRSGPELLIIYNNDFRNAVDKLVLWKERRGLRTEAVSVDSVGNSVAQIKQFIRSKRKPVISGSRSFRYPRLRYVLLFGDVDTIASEDVRANIF